MTKKACEYVGHVSGYSTDGHCRDCDAGTGAIAYHFPDLVERAEARAAWRAAGRPLDDVPGPNSKESLLQKAAARRQAAIDAGHPEWADLPGTIEEARDANATLFFSGVPCPAGHVLLRRTAANNCTLCINETAKAHAKTPKARARCRVYEKTPKARARSREYQKTPAQRSYFAAHRKTPKMREWFARYRALQLSASPPWLTAHDKADMAAIYAEAARLTETTGIEHHVDHVVPMIAKCPVSRKQIACGLHLTRNLTPLPGVENIVKNCWFDAEAEATAHWEWLTERGLTSASRKRIAA